MGATDWCYKTAYHDDPNIALQELRAEVFAFGRYGYTTASIDLRDLPKGTPVAGRVLFGVFAFASQIAAIGTWAIRGFPVAKSIDEALAIAGETGTHSILDIQKCSKGPSIGCASPVSKRLLLSAFGTDKPNDVDVTRWSAQDLSRDLERWHCMYFAVYRDGMPVAYYFVGSSGD